MAVTHEDIFIEWVKAYKGLFLKIAKAFAADRSTQEDLIQEMMLQLWISVPNFKQQAKESTWVYRVAFNTALVWNRNRKKHKRLKSITFIENQHAAAANPGKDGLIEELYAVIRQLPKVEASLILMSLEGISYQEMAETMGISESNVGVKLNRAKKKLSEKMKGLNNEL